MPWLQRHRLTRSCGLAEGAMIALVTKTQTYQFQRSGRRGPGYKDRLTTSGDLADGALVALVTKTDLPGPAIWQTGPWLPWLLRQTYQVRRSGRRGPGCPGYKDTDVPGPAIWQKGAMVALVTKTQTYQVRRSGRRGHGCPGCRSRLCPQCTSAGRRLPVVHRRWRQSCTCC